MPAAWSQQATDSGRLLFHRDSGFNILLPDPASRRSAPRVLQIGLLTPCNLSCHFCYRDTSAPSRLTADFLQGLLRECASWGVLEVAFGGGEPLLFKGFPELVHTLTRETSLGINFTTNGVLLTDAMLAKFEGNWNGEIRLSAYPDNGYRETLKRLRRHGRKAGLNWLITSANLPQLEAVVRDALARGADNVMLLGYKGPDPAMHLNAAEMGRLAESLRRLEHLPIRLDICWHPDLADVPQLFRRPDCGAGDEILVITPDRALQPCSFHHERVPFETFADLQRIYADFRSRRPSAEARGCTRDRFVPVAPVLANTVYTWQAHAGNNSGDTTIIGRFRTAEQAEKAAAALREMAVAHERWIAANTTADSYPDASKASPPILRFAAAHGFTWPEEEGLWWEEQAFGAPNLTTAAIGREVVIYHHYCMHFDDAPFADFFAQTGAEAYTSGTYERPLAVITGTGGNEAAVLELRLYLEVLRMFDHPSESEDTPPWGSECSDPRVTEDIDKSAQLGSCETNSCEYSGSRLQLQLSFENCFAGPLAVIAYLERHGFREIELRFEAEFAALAPIGAGVVEPRTGLFPDIASPVDHLKALSPMDRWREVFSGKVMESRELSAYLRGLPREEVAEFGYRAWQEHAGERNPVVSPYLTVSWIEYAGPLAAEWARAFWIESAKVRKPLILAFRAMLKAVPIDEVLDLGAKHLVQVGQEAGDFVQTVNRHLADAELFGMPSRAVLARFLDVAEVQIKQPAGRRKIARDWGSSGHFDQQIAELRAKLVQCRLP